MELIIIKPTRLPELANFHPNLENLQREVGGYIEALPFMDDCTMYVDEEGKFKEDTHPINAIATALMHKYGRLPADDFIRGAVVITGPLDDEGDETEVPGHVIDAVMAFRLD